MNIEKNHEDKRVFILQSEVRMREQDCGYISQRTQKFHDIGYTHLIDGMIM